MSQYFSFLKIKYNLLYALQPSPGWWVTYWELSICVCVCVCDMGEGPGVKPLSPFPLCNSRILDLARPGNWSRKDLLHLCGHHLCIASSCCVCWALIFTIRLMSSPRSCPHSTRTGPSGIILQFGVLCRALFHRQTPPHSWMTTPTFPVPKLTHSPQFPSVRNLLLALFPGSGGVLTLSSLLSV